MKKAILSSIIVSALWCFSGVGGMESENVIEEGLKEQVNNDEEEELKEPVNNNEEENVNNEVNEIVSNILNKVDEIKNLADNDEKSKRNKYKNKNIDPSLYYENNITSLSEQFEKLGKLRPNIDAKNYIQQLQNIKTKDKQEFAKEIEAVINKLIGDLFITQKNENDTEGIKALFNCAVPKIGSKRLAELMKAVSRAMPEIPSECLNKDGMFWHLACALSGSFLKQVAKLQLKDYDELIEQSDKYFDKCLKYFKPIIQKQAPNRLNLVGSTIECLMLHLWEDAKLSSFFTQNFYNKLLGDVNGTIEFLVKIIEEEISRLSSSKYSEQGLSDELNLLQSNFTKVKEMETNSIKERFVKYVALHFIWSKCMGLKYGIEEENGFEQNNFTEENNSDEE